MKHFYSLIVIVGLLVAYGFKTSGFQMIKHDRDEIEVSLVYDNEVNVIQVKNYSRLEQIIDLDNYPEIDLNKINLTQILSHGDVITIPIITETPCISLNHGSVDELMLLSGVGEKTAEAIIAYRSEHGLFQNPHDLMNIKGIGQKKYDKMASQLCL